MSFRLAAGASRMSNHRIGLYLHATRYVTFQVMRGVQKFWLEHPALEIVHPEGERMFLEREDLRRLKLDGVVTRLQPSDGDVVAELKQRRIPFVNVGGLIMGEGIRTVKMDNRRFAELVVEHFRTRGFRTVYHFGDFSLPLLTERQTLLMQLGTDAEIMFQAVPFIEGEWEPTVRALEISLRGIPRPAAIMASHDALARKVLEACRHLGYSVPKDFAVLGSTNDELECSLCLPPLSAVADNLEEIGFRAISTLYDLLEGKKPGELVERVPPRGVIGRRSTEVFVHEDPLLNDALDFIRRNAVQGLSSADVLKKFGVNRRLLERKFKKALGRTPYELIFNLRMDHARKLLRDSRLSIDAIAEQCAFSGAAHFSLMFNRKFGITPSQYRQGETDEIERAGPAKSGRGMKKPAATPRKRTTKKAS